MASWRSADGVAMADLLTTKELLKSGTYTRNERRRKISAIQGGRLQASKAMLALITRCYRR
jgi:glycerate-2-kinase